MSASEHRTYDLPAIKDALPFPEVVGREVGELQRAGSLYQCSCPFHEERSASFTCYGDHGYCFGCHWRGDIFNFWSDYRQVTLGEAFEQLAGLAGVAPKVESVTFRHKKSTYVDAPAGSVRSVDPSAPVAPPLRALTGDEILQLAKLRGLDALAVRCAARDFRRVGACMWPQWCGPRGWEVSRDASPSWVICDDERTVFDFRRLNGEPYTMRGREMKVWSKGSKKWPVGAAEIGDRVNVLLCEGGPDILAAYHFLRGYGGTALLESVAVVGMLGTGYIAEEALPFFKGKRVRMMVDADRAKPPAVKPGEPKPEPLEVAFDDANCRPVIPAGWKVPSLEAARKWTDQLTAAGAAVRAFSLYGLWQANGERVGDLNDLALADGRTLGTEEIQAAFLDWDF